VPLVVSGKQYQGCLRNEATPKIFRIRGKPSFQDWVSYNVEY
jgi:hypothetical protein